ncbi:hypothetical protein, partial [Escherichia coli]
CSLLAPSDAILFQEGVSVKLRLPHIALLQDDVDPKNATEERHCCWQIEEVSGFVTPEKRSPAIIAGGAVQLIIVCL